MDCGSTEHTEKMVSEFSARVFIRYIKISWTDLSSHKSRHNDNCPWDSSPCLSSSSALPGTAAGRDSGHQASVPDSDIAYILNRGAAKASQPYLLFLEPDLVYTWDVLSRAIKIMEENENVGLIAIPQDNNEGWLSLSKEAAVQRTGATFYCNENNAGWQVEEFCPARLKDYIDSPAAKPHQSIPAFSGTSLLCRKTDFDKLGGFSPADESPGIVADFCMRMARELGKKCIALKNTGVQVCQDSCHQHVSLWNFEHTSLQDILHSARRASKRKHWSSAATYW